MPRIKKRLNSGQMIGSKKFYGGKSGKYVYSYRGKGGKLRRHKTGKKGF